MLFSLKHMPVKGLDFTFVAERSQQQFVMPVFHRKYIWGQYMPSYNKTHLERLRKMESLRNFCHRILLLLFCEGNDVIPLHGRLWGTAPDLSPGMQGEPKNPLCFETSHMEPICSSQIWCLLEAALSEPYNQERPVFMVMLYLISSFLVINSFILKNSQWDIYHSFMLLFLKNRRTVLSCRTSNRKLSVCGNITLTNQQSIHTLLSMCFVMVIPFNMDHLKIPVW